MHISPPPPSRMLLVDGSSLLYRAFYALKPLHTKEGVAVQAVYGFFRILKKVIDTLSPAHIVVAWDSPGKGARHALFPHYKAKRLAPPQDLFYQKQLIEQGLDAMSIAQYGCPGYEADDIIFTMTEQLKESDFNIIIVTSDKDLAQLVDEQRLLYDTSQERLWGVDEVIAKFGLSPKQLPLYFALLGDASDNIPGVTGIGAKSAQQLAQQYATLDELYANLDSLQSSKQKSLLQQGKENAYLSKTLFQLQSCPYLTFDQTKTKLKETYWQDAYAFFSSLEFTSLMRSSAATISSTVTSGAGAPARTLEPFCIRYGIAVLIITTREQLTNACLKIRIAKGCALDTETTSGAPIGGQLVGISLCCQTGQAYYIPVAHETREEQVTQADLLELLLPVLRDTTLAISFHNAKFDLLVLQGYGMEGIRCSFDTMIAAGLVAREGERVGLKTLSERLLNETMLSFAEVVTRPGYACISQVPLALAADYAAADAHQTWQLVPILKAALQQEQQENLYRTLELPLMIVLKEMEREGIIVDTQELAHIGREVATQIAHTEQSIRTLVGNQGAEINLNAPRQVEKLLFGILGLTPIKKTASGGYSTDHEVLTQLADRHIVPQLLLTYRELSKLQNTYINALPDYVNARTGRIHSSFSQISTATGRLASSDPNLQNIPVAPLPGITSIRSAFKAPEGCQFISADYSQIELRVLAYISQDAHLIKAFLEGEDIHAMTASRIYSVALCDVTHEQRQVGKRINFSILYGLTPYGLSQDLKISLKEARTAIDTYFSSYPAVQVWMEQVIEETKKNGYVTTLGGRRRYLPGMYEKNKTLYEMARRIAINTVIQGTAAEIMKQGMLMLSAQFNKAKYSARLVLQIHDELLVSSPHAETPAVCEELINILESVVTWNVPLRVTTRIGDDWGAVTK